MKLLDIIKEENQRMSPKEALALKKAEVYFKAFRKGTRYSKDLETKFHYEIVEDPIFKTMKSDDDVNYVPVIKLTQKFEEPIKIMVETNDGEPPYEAKRAFIGFTTQAIWQTLAKDVQNRFYKEGVMLLIY